MAETIGASRNNGAAAASAKADSQSVRCLLMPFHGFNVLMPNTAVAEVVAYEQPRRIEQAPAWLKGFVSWRGRNVPVIAMETILGSTEGSPTSQARLIIFNALGEGKSIPFLAMVAQGIPRLLALRGEDLRYLPGERKQETGIYTRLLVDGNTVVVPDLEQLEKMLIQIGVRERK